MTALPLPFRLRLRPQSALALGLPGIAAEGPGGGGLPLVAIVLLEPHDEDDAPELEPVDAVEAFGALMPQAYCFSLEEGKEELVEAYLRSGAPRAGVAPRVSAGDRPPRRGGRSARGAARRVSGRPRLGASEWLLVVRMACWRGALPLLRRAVSLDRLVRVVASPRQCQRDPAREELIARVGARLWRSAPGPCLERSLAIYRQLGLAGTAPQLAIGVAREDGAVIAHAWVVVDGAALLEPADPAGEYGVAVAFDPHGRPTMT